MHPSVAADLASAFNDPFATVSVVIDGVSTRGFDDTADQIGTDAFGESGQLQARIISIQTGTLGDALVIDAEILIEGEVASVRQIALSDDGQIQHIRVAD